MLLAVLLITAPLRFAISTVVAQVLPHGDLPAQRASGKLDLGWLSAGQSVRAPGAVPVAKLLRDGFVPAAASDS